MRSTAQARNRGGGAPVVRPEPHGGALPGRPRARVAAGARTTARPVVAGLAGVAGVVAGLVAGPVLAVGLAVPAHAEDPSTTVDTTPVTTVDTTPATTTPTTPPTPAPTEATTAPTNPPPPVTAPRVTTNTTARRTPVPTTSTSTTPPGTAEPSAAGAPVEPSSTDATEPATELGTVPVTAAVVPPSPRAASPTTLPLPSFDADATVSSSSRAVSIVIIAILGLMAAGVVVASRRREPLLAGAVAGGPTALAPADTPVPASAAIEPSADGASAPHASATLVEDGPVSPSAGFDTGTGGGAGAVERARVGSVASTPDAAGLPLFADPAEVRHAAARGTTSSPAPANPAEAVVPAATTAVTTGDPVVPAATVGSTPSPPPAPWPPPRRSDVLDAAASGSFASWTAVRGGSGSPAATAGGAIADRPRQGVDDPARTPTSSVPVPELWPSAPPTTAALPYAPPMLAGPAWAVPARDAGPAGPTATSDRDAAIDLDAAPPAAPVPTLPPMVRPMGDAPDVAALVELARRKQAPRPDPD